ncbi:NPCBM/NEW2 domain-containing protein [Cellvibrio sp. PSBB023]|uniref:NPCBM/NEW2 domain-containing protein n=1 Tax=Cellvibrio sp. PSBB023 TaxID=1945512 RepID=UPI0009C31D56|nr:NPCBM/NEW2 domain-containing protein [Cellvibrio sp. PSBB023]AQT59180.1 hypothetical protein B0D95_03070 [Cellvibrio sp. PSBB023]
MLAAVGQSRFRYEILVFFAVLLLGALVRFYALGSVPAGLNQDEASMGYDAYALLHYGADRNGMHNPVQMIAWGSGQNALQAYATIPFIALFDLSVFSIRLVPALFGVFCLALFYWVARRIAGPKLAVVALFILAISPWHIVLSRWALESNFLPGTMLVAMALLIFAQERPRLLYLSFAFFAVSLYAYSTAYAFVPVFFLMYGIYALWHRIYSIKDWIIACSVFAVVAAPIMLFVIVNLFKLETIDLRLFSVPRMPGEARYTHMTSFFSNEFWGELAKNFHRVIEILFIQFNDRETQSSVKDIGTVYAFSIPFLFIGLILFFRDLWREKRASAKMPILLWLIAALGVAILSWPAVHRMNLVFFPLILLIAYGVRAVWLKSNVIFAVIMLVYLGLFVRFEKVYFTEYAEEVGAFFFESYTDAVGYAYKHADVSHTLYVSDNLNQPYIHVLFVTKYDVKDYISTVDIPNRSDAFQIVKSFGRFVFGVQTPQAAEGKVIVARNDEARRFPQERYIAKAFKNYTALFNRDYYGLNADGDPVSQSNKFELVNPAVSNDQITLIKPEALASVSNVSFQAFYSPDKAGKLPFNIADNKLVIDAEQLPEGINKIIVVSKLLNSEVDSTQFFLVFKSSESLSLLDLERLHGAQSFGALEKNRAYEGSVFTHEEFAIPWGFGAHADSSYAYELPVPMASLEITVAMSQASGNCGDGAVFEIWGNGTPLVNADLAPAQSRKLLVDLKGINALEFKTYMKESPHCDHTNWIAPVFTLAK